jgi:ZZ-type zinc finger-containing protein 3
MKYNVKLPSSTNEQDTETDQKIQAKQPHVNFWTLDEQRKLEDLLNKFPPEAIESQRFKKIAKAMGGTRTPKQIASRVQKFFKKLQEENLPIPGSSSLKMSRKRRCKQSFKFERPSTFFPERNIPSDLVMRESASEDEVQETICEPSERTEQDKSTRVLSFLKQVRDIKAKFENSPYLFKYSGDNCSSCGENIQLGMRWTCKDCATVSVTCSDCFTTALLEDSCEHLFHNLVYS